MSKKNMFLNSMLVTGMF